MTRSRAAESFRRYKLAPLSTPPVRFPSPFISNAIVLVLVRCLQLQLELDGTSTGDPRSFGIVALERSRIILCPFQDLFYSSLDLCMCFEKEIDRILF